VKNECSKDDKALIEACAAGDVKAWAQLVNKYSRLIDISIDRHLKKYGIEFSCQDIEDIRQEILSSLWKGRKLETVRGRRDISYWLSIVSANAALEYMRRKRRLEPAKLVGLFDMIGERSLAELIPSSEIDPGNASCRNELLKKADRVIRGLPQKEKLVIKLDIIHNKKHAEIADMLKMPIGTVSSYIKRAKEKLQRELKDFF